VIEPVATDNAGLARQAAALLAVDPFGLGGATIRAPAGPARDAWLEALRAMMPDKAPWRRMPAQIATSRLLGGLDLAATLVAGRPIAERGLLEETADGVLVVPMAERIGGAVAGPLAMVLDGGEVVVEREGVTRRVATRFACVLLDEGIDDERAPDALCERLAFRLDLAALRPSAFGLDRPDPSVLAAARTRVAAVRVDDAIVEALCAAGAAFGVSSLRVATLALRAAKAAAALAGRDHVAAEDATLAAALVIAPRATTMPAAALDEEPVPEDEPGQEQPPQDPPPPPDDLPEDSTHDEQPEPPPGSEDRIDPKTLADQVLEATKGAIPLGLLDALKLGTAARVPSSAGRAGVNRQSAKRGRPAGVRRGLPGPGGRLAIVDTLRAAAPWQPLRRRNAPAASEGRVLVRREDFRIGRFKEKSETVTIFVVDASGSAALHRLAEVKGAVELILAECYVRRDSVAFIAFRGSKAEIILPPTRSLARAKRALAGQAGGGGTPLATAVEATMLLCGGVKRKGQVPLAVFLTDGKANIDRDGRAGRPQAEADALGAARAFRAAGCAALVLDIAPRPGEAAARLAGAMGARYLPLPYADARGLSQVVLGAQALEADGRKATQR
jgi:magnesium chelatase subunit D